MSPHLTESKYKNDYTQQVKNKSDVLVNYFLASYFIVGLVLAFFYNTWLVAIGLGGLSIIAYYAAKHFLPRSDFYQYVLSTVLGVFMAQYIYQVHGLFEMHFAAFVGSAMLVTYQKWKLQLPLLSVVIVHHALFAYLQFKGVANVYTTQLNYMDIQTFIIHILFTTVIFFLCGLWAYQFNKYSTKYNKLNFDMGRMEEEEEQKKKLLQVRDHLKASYTRLNEAEKIAGMGSWERNYINNILIWSDQMFRIFDIDKTGFNVSYDAYLSFIHPDDRESVKDIHKKYEHDNQPFAYECRIISLKGIAKTIYVQGKVVLNDKSEIIKTNGVVQDITERKQVEKQMRQSEKYNRNIFNMSSSGLALARMDGTIVDANYAYAKIIGRSVEDVHNLSYRQITPEKYIDRENEILSQLQVSGQYAVYEKEYIHNKGHLVPVRMSGCILEKDGEKYILSTVEDITESKRVHEELVQKNNELSKANAELDNIVYCTSHDLRSPLTSVLGLADFIEEETKEPDTLEHVRMIKSRIKRIDDLVENIHNYTLNNRLDVKPARIYFDKAISQSINSMQHINEAAKIDFRIQVNQEVPFHSDEQRLVTVLNNMVSNGIKFHNPDVETPFIAINVNTTPLNAEIIFEDNGVGISKEHHHKIFDPFYCTEPVTPGSGIGLYLVKEIVSKLNGNIQFESVPGEGTSFKINLKNLINASNN